MASTGKGYWASQSSNLLSFNKFDAIGVLGKYKRTHLRCSPYVRLLTTFIKVYSTNLGVYQFFHAREADVSTSDLHAINVDGKQPSAGSKRHVVRSTQNEHPSFQRLRRRKPSNYSRRRAGRRLGLRARNPIANKHLSSAARTRRFPSTK